MLSPIEVTILDALVLGQPVKGPQIDEVANPWTIRASILRLALLGLPIDDKHYCIPRCGIKLENVVIEGRLNLDGMDGAQHDRLPSLYFKYCRFHGGFSANNANIQSLRMKGSLFDIDIPDEAAVCFDNALINGSCNLSDIGPLHENRYCRVSGRNCHIQGTLILTGATLTCPIRETLEPRQTPRAGLMLTNAIIEGDVEVKVGLKASGLGFRNAKILGDFWLLGSRVFGAESHAVNFQGLQCSGSIVFRTVYDASSNTVHQLVIEGAVFCLGMVVKSLQLDGVHLLPAANPESDANTVRLLLSRARLTGRLSIDACFFNQSNYSFTKIDGDIEADNTQFEDSVWIKGVDCSGKISLANAQIKKDLCVGSQGRGGVVNRTVIGNDLNLARLTVAKSIYFQAIKVENQVVATGIDVGGDFTVYGHFDAETGEPIVTEINKGFVANSARITGVFSISGGKIGAGLYMPYTRIGHNLELNSRASNNEHGELRCFKLHIDGDINISSTVTEGNHFFSSIHVAGCLIANMSVVNMYVAFSAISAEENDWNSFAGGICYDHAKCVQQFALQYTKVDQKFGQNQTGISIEYANIDESLLVSEIELNTRLSIQHSDILGGMQIALVSVRDPFSEPGFPAVLGTGVRIDGIVKIQGAVESLDLSYAKFNSDATVAVQAQNNILFRHASMQGSLTLENLSIVNEFSLDDLSVSWPTVSFSHTQITDALIVLRQPPMRSRQEFISRSWVSKLICYPDMLYIKAQVNRSDGNWMVNGIIEKEHFEAGRFEEIMLFNGESSVFHKLNAQNKLCLTSISHAEEYLRLFCENVWGDAGPFYIIDQWLPEWSVQQQSAVCTEGTEAICGPENILIADNDPVVSKLKLKKSDRYLFKAYLLYGNHIFKALLRVNESGQVEMDDDELFCIVDDMCVVESKKPFHSFDSVNPVSIFRYAKTPAVISDEQIRDNLQSQIKHTLTKALRGNRGLGLATIDMTHCRTRILDDDAGRAWGEYVTLKLRNFNYHAFGLRDEKDGDVALIKIARFVKWRVGVVKATVLRTLARMLTQLPGKYTSDAGQSILNSKASTNPVKPKNSVGVTRRRVKYRLQWLGRQFALTERRGMSKWVTKCLNLLPLVNRSSSHRPVTNSQFTIQPYIQASTAFRREGVQELARKIDVEARYHAGFRSALNAGLMSLVRYPLHCLYGLSSKFGLSPTLVFIWIVVWILIGGVFTDVANRQGILVARSVSVSSTIETETQKLMGVLPGEPAVPFEQAACGKRIEPMLFAADVFIPLIDLGQFEHCYVTPGEVAEALPMTNQSALTKLTSWLSKRIELSRAAWRWGQGLYAVLGWIMLSLFIFTLTYRLSGYRSDKIDIN